MNVRVSRIEKDNRLINTPTQVAYLCALWHGNDRRIIYIDE